MNLNTSDQRLKKKTVSVSNDVLKKLQRSVNKKINNLRAQGKLTKASLPTIICLFALSLFEVQAVTTFTESFDNDNANWGNTASEPAIWVESGGADGGGSGGGDLVNVAVRRRTNVTNKCMHARAEFRILTLRILSHFFFKKNRGILL